MKWRLKIFSISLLVGFNALSLANNSDTLAYTEKQDYHAVDLMNLEELKVITDKCNKKFSDNLKEICKDPKVIERFSYFLKIFPEKITTN